LLSIGIYLKKYFLILSKKNPFCSFHRFIFRTSPFGDTSLITRIMLLETRNTTLLSLLETTLPTGDEDRGLGSGLTTVSPGIGLWRDLGSRYALHGFFGLDIPVGGKDDEDPDTTVRQ
jgi:hypothetical protein